MHNVENFSKAKRSEKNAAVHKKNIKFKEIQCPQSNSKLIVSNCYKCQHSQKIQSTHESRRTLTSMICLYGTKSEGGFE